MKVLLTLVHTLCLVYILALPYKMSMGNPVTEEDLTTGKFINPNFSSDRYPIYMASPSNLIDQRQRLNSINELRAYLNLLNMDAFMLRKLMLTKLLTRMASDNRQWNENNSKIKRNFDEIDKTSNSFSTFNQLI